MKLHILLTDDIAPSKPETCKIVMDFGRLKVRFDDGTWREGLHCVLEDTTLNFAKWLQPFDGFVMGSGNPAFEEFFIQHIKPIPFDYLKPNHGDYICMVWASGSECECIYNGLDESITPLPTHWFYPKTKQS